MQKKNVEYINLYLTANCVVLFSNNEKKNHTSEKLTRNFDVITANSDRKYFFKWQSQAFSTQNILYGIFLHIVLNLSLGFVCICLKAILSFSLISYQEMVTARYSALFYPHKFKDLTV